MFRLPCSACRGEGGALQARISGVCGERLQCLGHTGFAVCAVPVYPAQAPGCSAGELSEAGPGLRALPGSKLFRFLGTPQMLRLGWAYLLCPSFPGPSSSGSQVLGELTLHSGAVHLVTSLVPATWFPGCAATASSQVCRVAPLGSKSLAVALLVDVNRP